MGGTAITRRRMLGLLGAAAIGTAVGCGSSVEDDDEAAAGGGGDGGTLRVGLVIPQSGVYTSLGTDMKNAWDLWLDEHDNMIGGREVETETADEGETPDSGVAALGGLLQRNVDVLVGVVNSAVALGSRDQVAEAQKLLLIANAGANDVTGSARSPYIWRTSFTNSQVALPLGEYMASAPDSQDGVFAVAADYAAGHESIAGFKKGFADAGGTVLGEAASPFGTTQDFQPYLTQIRQSGATAVYCFYAGAEAVNFVKQFAQFGLSRDVQLYGNGFLTEGGVLEAQGDDAIGVRTSLHYSTELENPANQGFVEAYTAAYGGPPTVYAVQVWDAALVLDQAVAAADDVSGDALSEALGGLGEISDSPRGPWSFDGQTPRQPFYLREVERKEGVLVNAVVEDLGVIAQPEL
ncbi:MAG: ABC transporter substrate-binding protein [Acidimicrobiales bacterium]